MSTKRNRARIGIIVCALLAAPALVLLVLSGGPGRAAGPSGSSTPVQAGAVITPGPQAATAVFVKFDGVDGESQDKDHRGWSDLLSFSQGQYVPPSQGPAGRTTPVFEEVVLKKELDKSSPKLAEAACKGTSFPKVEIHVTRTFPDAGRVTYYTCELKNVRVMSYHVGGSTQDTIPVDEISLNFGAIKATYTETDSKGQAGGNVEYTWKVEEGES